MRSPREGPSVLAKGAFHEMGEKIVTKPSELGRVLTRGLRKKRKRFFRLERGSQISEIPLRRATLRAKKIRKKRRNSRSRKEDTGVGQRKERPQRQTVLEDRSNLHRRGENKGKSEGGQGGGICFALHDYFLRSWVKGGKKDTSSLEEVTCCKTRDRAGKSKKTSIKGMSMSSDEKRGMPRMVGRFGEEARLRRGT